MAGQTLNCCSYHFQAGIEHFSSHGLPHQHVWQPPLDAWYHLPAQSSPASHQVFQPPARLKNQAQNCCCIEARRNARCACVHWPCNGVSEIPPKPHAVSIAANLTSDLAMQTSPPSTILVFLNIIHLTAGPVQCPAVAGIANPLSRESINDHTSWRSISKSQSRGGPHC